MASIFTCYSQRKRVIIEYVCTFTLRMISRFHLLSSRRQISKHVLREKPLPEHSHSIQGVAHTPPKTLTGRSGVPSQPATPVSRWVPLFDSSHTHSHSWVLPHPSGSTLGFPKQNLRHDIRQMSLLSATALQNSLSWVAPERDPEQRNPWAIIPLQFKFLPCTNSPCGVQAAADPMVLFGSGGFCPLLAPSIVSGQAEDSFLIFREALLLSMDELTSLSSSCN